MRNPSRNRQGFTVLELVAAVAVIGILLLIVFSVARGVRDRARLAEAVSDVRNIQRIAMSQWRYSGTIPTNEELDGLLRKGGETPVHELYEIVDLNAEDPNAGHGNDPDMHDEDNPGNAPREPLGGVCIVFSKRDLALAAYVYAIDDKTVQIADPGTNPLHINHGNHNGNGNGNGGGNGNGNGGNH